MRAHRVGIGECAYFVSTCIHEFTCRDLGVRAY